MRYVVAIFLLTSAACGDKSNDPFDLSVLIDAAEPIVDLATPADLLPPPACSLPVAKVYLESVGYQFVQIGSGGSPSGVFTASPASVTNRGQIVRPKTPFTSATYHCEFTEANIDAMTCTAPCCPGQPSSPIVYVDASGWSLWQSGSCAYAAGSAQYVATIIQIATMSAH